MKEGLGSQKEEERHLVIDKPSQRKIIKQIRKVLPDVGVAVLSQAFIVEPVPTPWTTSEWPPSCMLMQGDIKRTLA